MPVTDRLKQWAPAASYAPTDGSLMPRGANRCLADPRAIMDKERKTAHMVASARYVKVAG